MAPDHPLFALQGLDLEVRELEEERRTLPERSAIARCTETMAGERGAAEAARARCAALGEQIAEREAETNRLSQRIETEEAKLYSGAVTVAKELEGLQGEVQGLKARRSSIEEEQLALMEAEEERKGDVRACEEQIAALECERAELAARLEARENALDREIADRETRRVGLVRAVPEPLREPYERLRTHKGLAGRVLSELKGRNCGRCGLTVREMALTALEGSGEVVHCDGCGRILLKSP